MVVNEKGEKLTNHCRAFCPEYGKDLAFMHGECFCKGRDCDYHCRCQCHHH